jgi:hypothetical protein
MPHFGRTQMIFAALACLTLAVGAYAVWKEYDSFPPYLRGFGEVTPRGEVAGWAVDPARPSEAVEVELYVDGRFVAHARADLPRADVVAAGRAAAENCGYSFTLPPLAPGPHEARVYALHAPGGGAELRTLRQLGNPLRFTAGADGRAGR